MTVSTRVCCSIISLTQVPYAVTDRRGSSVDGDGDGDGGDVHAALAGAAKNLEMSGWFGLAVPAPSAAVDAAVLPL
jgi:hypothetical protein